MELQLLVVTGLVALIFRKEIEAYINRAAIKLKALKKANRFAYLDRGIEGLFKTLKQMEASRVAGYGSVLEQVAVIRAKVDELASKVPTHNAANHLEEILHLQLTVEAINNKLSSPEAEQINATYMQSLASLSKAAEAQLASQEKVEKLLTLIVNRLNNNS